MLTRRQLTDRVKVLRRQVTQADRGNRTYSWPDAAGVEAVPGLLQQTSATEVTTELGTTATTDWLLLLLPDQTVSAYDRVQTADGSRKFEVIGEPAVYAGRLAHVEARLRSVTY